MCTDQVRGSDRAIPNPPQEEPVGSVRGADGCQSPDPGIRSTEVACQAMPRRGATDTVSEQDRLSLPGCRVAPCGGDRPHGTRLTKSRDRPYGCRGIRIRHGLRDSHGESARSDNSGRRDVRVLCSSPNRAGVRDQVRVPWRPRDGWCGPIRPRDLPIQWLAVPGTSGLAVSW